MKIGKLSSKEKRVITILDGENGRRTELVSLASILGIVDANEVTDFRQNEIGNLVRMGYARAETTYRQSNLIEEIYLNKPGERAKNILQGNYYIDIMVRDPSQEKYTMGWLSRVDFIKK